MRTTLTIEDALARDLKRLALETGKPFKQVVNETLLAGLRSARAPAPYSLQPASMGLPASGIDLTKALRLGDELEDEALLAKLEQRK